MKQKLRWEIMLLCCANKNVSRKVASLGPSLLGRTMETYNLEILNSEKLWNFGHKKIKYEDA